MGIEDQRQLAFHCSLGPDILLVRSFTGSEQLGACFEYIVTLYSLDANVEIESLLRQEASVEVRLGLSQPRFFSGIVSEISQRGSAGRYMVYEVVLRPWLWLLSRNSNCRVFQHLTTLEIAKKIFQEHDPNWRAERLFYKLKPRKYCVQFRESDLHFVSRLLEDEGMYYYFQHEKGKHTLVLADSVSSHEAAGGFDKIDFYKVVDGSEPVGVMTTWSVTKRVVPTKVTLNDYHFKKSRADLKQDKTNPKPPGAHEVYDYPGVYTDAEQGEARTRLRTEELGVGFDVRRGETNSRGLSTGNLFALQEHPRDDQNCEYLIIGAHYELDSGTYESGGQTNVQFKTNLTAIESQTQFRPPRTASEPLVSGVQTARVVGPSGQEIWTDEFGRVKVQFHWDREGKRDESSSCWIRVAQMWAGSGWGGVHIPRIGQEVVVEFVNGHLDNPLIVGCVYNDANKPPYTLPGNKTQSGVRSHSSLQGGPDDYNELRFEDKKGEEEVLLRAQRDLTTKVLHDSNKTVTNDMTVHIEKGLYATTVDKGPMTIEVPENDYSLSAKQIFAMGDELIKLDVGACELSMDKTSITIKAGASKIVLDASGVSVNGTMIKLNS